MKHKINLLLMFVIVISTITIVSADELPYFYSDTAHIGYDPYRLLFSQNIDGFKNADYDSYLDHAINQWKGAGISCYGVDEVDDSTIEFYGGTESTLAELESEILNYWALTYFHSETMVGTYTYQGINIRKWKQMKTYVYCPKQLTTANGFKNMFTHELGHSLGWKGHTLNPTSSDVMQMTPSSSRTTLTTTDKNHLKLVY